MTALTPTPDRGRVLARLLVRAVLACAGLAALGVYPAYVVGGAALVSVLALGLAIALLGSALGNFVTLCYPQQKPTDLVSAVMLGLAARFVATLAPTLALGMSGAVAGGPLALIVGAGKLTLLVLDTLGLLAALSPRIAAPLAADTGAAR